MDPKDLFNCKVCKKVRCLEISYFQCGIETWIYSYGMCPTCGVEIDHAQAKHPPNMTKEEVNILNAEKKSERSEISKQILAGTMCEFCEVPFDRKVKLSCGDFVCRDCYEGEVDRNYGDPVHCPNCGMDDAKIVDFIQV